MSLPHLHLTYKKLEFVFWSWACLGLLLPGRNQRERLDLPNVTRGTVNPLSTICVTQLPLPSVPRAQTTQHFLISPLPWHFYYPETNTRLCCVSWALGGSSVHPKHHSDHTIRNWREKPFCALRHPLAGEKKEKIAQFLSKITQTNFNPNNFEEEKHLKRYLCLMFLI